MLAALTWAAYADVGKFDFVSIDDDTYVYNNPFVEAGLSRESILWAFSEKPTRRNMNWAPLTWISFMADAEIYGLDPGGFHLTNLFLHVVNTILLFFLLFGMTRLPWRSAFVAALFALHPLHVESVAWISERKDVLCTFFTFLSMIIYVAYTRKKRTFLYMLSLSAMGLGVLTKAMIVTLPGLLMLLDYWPLRRIGTNRDGGNIEDPLGTEPLSKLILEKVPFLCLSLIASLIAIWAQSLSFAVMPLDEYPFIVRTANAVVSYGTYLYKTFWPDPLAVYYPHRGYGLPLWQIAVSSAALIVITLLAIRLARKRPYLPVGWGWYLGTLLPVIGVVQLGSQAMADRYTYVPQIGIFLAITWAAAEAMERWFPHRAATALVMVGVLAALGVRTERQVTHWKDSIALLEHAARTVEGNWSVLNNLGAEYYRRGMREKAIAFYTASLQIRPDSDQTHLNLAIAMAEAGRKRPALFHFTRAIYLNPRDGRNHFNMGIFLAHQGRADAAVREFAEAIRLNPEYAQAYYYLGVALNGMGKPGAARDFLERAVELDPSLRSAMPIPGKKDAH